MNTALTERLRYLCDVVEQEVRHLQATDQRLFTQGVYCGTGGCAGQRP